MSAERIEVLVAFRNAALVERDALVRAKEQIQEMTDERGTPPYPRMRALDVEIAERERDINQHESRINDLARNDSVPAGPSRLALLLRKQELALQERSDLVDARSTILREAEGMGLADLNDEQDKRFLALTREIALVDDEIAVRDKEIDELAALGGIHVDS